MLGQKLPKKQLAEAIRIGIGSERIKIVMTQRVHWKKDCFCIIHHR